MSKAPKPIARTPWLEPRSAPRRAWDNPFSWETIPLPDESPFSRTWLFDDTLCRWFGKKRMKELAEHKGGMESLVLQVSCYREPGPGRVSIYASRCGAWGFSPARDEPETFGLQVALSRKGVFDKSHQVEIHLELETMTEGEHWTMALAQQRRRIRDGKSREGKRATAKADAQIAGERLIQQQLGKC